MKSVNWTFDSDTIQFTETQLKSTRWKCSGQSYARTSMAMGHPLPMKPYDVWREKRLSFAEIRQFAQWIRLHRFCRWLRGMFMSIFSLSSLPIPSKFRTITITAMPISRCQSVSEMENAFEKSHTTAHQIETHYEVGGYFQRDMTCILYDWILHRVCLRINRMCSQIARDQFAIHTINHRAHFPILYSPIANVIHR